MSDFSSIDFQVLAGGSLQGSLQIPGDKSISHRALMFAALAEGESRLDGFLPSEDTLATEVALKALGVTIIHQSESSLTVQGVGLRGLKKPDTSLYFGNSGTSTRLMSGILAGAGIECEIRGDASLMTRPMSRIVEPLRDMGANISSTKAGTLPLMINSAGSLKAIEYTCPVASAQLKSCLLLAGLYAEGETIIHEPAVSRDHTERMLSVFGVELTQSDLTVSLKGGQSLNATNITIPADISSAAFFILGAAISEEGDVLLKQVGVNPTRHAVLTILQRMGADIQLSNQNQLAGEPVADIRVKASRLRGIDIPQSLVPIAIDEFPAIMIAAAVAEGKTTLRGAEELRVKESDRIHAMVEGLRALKVEVEEFEDGMCVTGGKIQGGRVNSYTDHRIAMSFAMAGLAANEPIIVTDCTNVATSFPGFTELARTAGLQLTEENIQ